MQKTGKNTSQQQTFDRTQFVFRMGGLFLVLNGLSLVLGVGYFLIGNAIYKTIIKLSMYWKPAYNIVYRDFLGIHTVFTPPQFNVWKILSITLSVVWIFFSVGIGIWILIRNDFCGQNLICMRLNR